ncbi:MAG: class V aminotransferase [Candidatus Aminicenantes bacterium RBG_13_63_10]|nr:MAG: class V aminotransferase [Candidatus Aminicenantes bacterium RBG_13_63_10]
MIKKSYLLSPGPTPLPEEVLAAAAEPLIHHRTPEFSSLFLEVVEGLKYVFGTKEEVYILTCSGTGAMEAAVVNVLSPGDKVLSISGGKFGERWARICRAYGLEVREIVLEWGRDFPKQKLAAELGSAPGIKAVFATLSETSTGALFDIQGYSEVVSRTEALLVVDGISGLGAAPCPMDEWKVDVLISASQKSFMSPPGLAYISLSPRAWTMAEKAELPRFYFDLRKARISLAEKTSPWTPAISLILQQKKALERIKSMGLEDLIEHHRILADAVRAGVRALDLELLAEKPGNILTAVKVPPGVDGRTLVKTMQSRFGVIIAGGQDPYKGKIFRIAHLGYMGGFDVITALSALEMTLSGLKYSFRAGDSLRAAQDVLEEKWT